MKPYPRNLKNLLFANDEGKKDPVLLAVTPPRTGERTLLGVENLLQSIAIPEPFSLELAGDADGVTLMARCLDDQVVRGQIGAHYPQARIHEVGLEDDPLRLEEGRAGVGRSPCGPTARTMFHCGSSATTTCSTPARTLSSPFWGRCPTCVPESASFRGCCCAPSAQTGRRTISKRPTGRLLRTGETLRTPTRPVRFGWTASRWPCSVRRRSRR